ncbi:C2 family cysteine protease [Methylobacterium sp. JK268]
MPNHNPVVTAKDANLQSGQSITAASLIGAVTDQDGDRIAQYRFYDPGTDGGHFILNGVVQPAGTWITVTAAQLSALSYVGGSAAGSKSLQVAASDGKGWSTTAVAKVTIAGPLDKLQDAGIRADVAGLMRNNSLDHASLLHILQDVAVGGVTASEFSTLKTLDSLLNAAGGITTSKADAYLADALINGNAANAHWTGGNAASVALGNLKAGTSQTQMSELIGKWFLGTDHPSTAGLGYASTYRTDTDPLFGAGGAVSNLDVNQGAVGDCYLMSSLAEIALHDPASIRSMFTDNGDGTYAVRFFDSHAKAVYVTVDSQLPTFTGSIAWANGSKLEFANGPRKWAALAEKAYVELNEEGILPHQAGDAYALIAGGWGDPITAITGKAVSSYAPGAQSVVNACKAGQEVMVATGSRTSGNFVSNHMFEVTAYNAANNSFELHNPWGSAVGNGGQAMTFWASVADLTANGCTMLAASGTAIA